MNKDNLAICDFEIGESRDVTDEGYVGKDEQFATGASRIAFTGTGSGGGGVWAIDNFLPEFTASR